MPCHIPSHFLYFLLILAHRDPNTLANYHDNTPEDEKPVQERIQATANPPRARQSHTQFSYTQRRPLCPPQKSSFQLLNHHVLAISHSHRALSPPAPARLPRKRQEKTCHRDQATPSHLHLCSHRQSPRHIAPLAAPDPPATISTHISDIHTPTSSSQSTAVTRQDTIKMPTDEENLQYLYLVLTSSGAPNVGDPATSLWDMRY
jgi:hypothetical protein